MKFQLLSRTIPNKTVALEYAGVREYQIRIIALSKLLEKNQQLSDLTTEELGAIKTLSAVRSNYGTEISNILASRTTNDSTCNNFAFFATVIAATAFSACLAVNSLS